MSPLFSYNKVNSPRSKFANKNIWSEVYRWGNSWTHICYRSYLENATNTAIKDLNYARLKLLEEESSQRIQELEAENRNLRFQLRKTETKAEKLGRGWFLCVRYICSFSTHLRNIAVFSYHGGMEGTYDGMKRALSNIYWTAKGLKDRDAKLRTELERVRRS
jgi:hypothetical protein